MEDFFDKFGFLIIEIIVGSVILSTFLFLISYEKKSDSDFIDSISESMDTKISTAYELPTLDNIDFIVKNGILELGSEFDWRDYVSVYSQEGNNLIDKVNVNGTVDTSRFGEYEITFTLISNTDVIVKKGKYYVT